MKYQNEFLGSRSDCRDNLKGVFNDIFAGSLVVEGQTVVLPGEDDLEVKVKYSTDVAGNSLTIKISWENAEENVVD